MYMSRGFHDKDFRMITIPVSDKKIPVIAEATIPPYKPESAEMFEQLAMSEIAVR